MLELMEARVHDDIIFIAMKMMSSCVLVEGLGMRLDVTYFVQKNLMPCLLLICICTKPTLHVTWIAVLLGACLRKEER